MIKQKKIPTLLGLVIIIVGIAGGVWLIQKGSIWFLRAEPTITPKQVRITNITDGNFTVSWVTENETTGFVKYGSTTTLDSISVDDRDQISGDITPFTTHYVTVENLNQKTTYYFKLGSGKNLYDDNGKQYQVTTAPTITTPLPPSDLAYGTILKPDESLANGVIVYLSLANTTPLSALTKTSGSWLITLNNARTNDLNTYISYDKEASIEEIFVQGGATGTAAAIVTTKNDSPVPNIVLGKSYDFREVKKPEEEENETPPQASGFSPEPITTSQGANQELKITSPSEGEKINTTKPEIFGEGPGGLEIEIILESPSVYSDKISIDANGSWRWTPPENLEPGEHTVTAKYTDEEGKEHLISHLFVVLAAGEDLPSFEATPSATISPFPTSTPTPLASPSPSPTASPTATPATRATAPSTEAGVPEPGYLTPTFLFLIMGLVMFSLGILII